MKQIVDQFGNPFDLRAMRTSQTEALASIRSLQSEHDQHPARGLTPARINAILKQAEAGDWTAQIDLASDMEERDTQIFSELAKRKQGILKLAWDVVGPDDATDAEKAQAEQIKSWLQGIKGFKRVVVWNLLDGILKGFAMVEMTWSLQGGILKPAFTPIPQSWFCQSEDRTQIHLRDHTAYGQALRPYNWLAHRHPARSGYPARQALSRVLMFPYLYKNYATRDMAEFLEIYGLPMRLGKYPAGATDKEKLTLLRAVTEIGHNAAGIIPLGMEIEFESAAQGTQVPFEAMCTRMDAALSKAIIGQTLTSSEGQHGSQALGNVHNDIRLDILASDAELIAETLTEQLLAPMALLNLAGADPERLPRFVFEVPEPEDIALMADALPKLAGAGVQIGVNWVARKLRIPEPDEGEATLNGLPEPTPSPGAPGALAGKSAPPAKEPPAKAPPAKAPPAKAALSMLAADPPPAASVRDALDDVVDDAMAQWQPMLLPLLAPVFAQLGQALAAGQTLQQFAASLEASLPELSQAMQSGPMAERLAQAGFIAALAGEADLDI